MTNRLKKAFTRHTSEKLADSNEFRPVFWASAYFFFLLSSYYLLRPVRDEMAIQGGVQHLPWLMTGTFITLLALTPIFGWLSGHLSRRAMFTTVYVFFFLNLLGFYFLMISNVPQEWIARVFYIWLSVYNLFVVSIFWSFMDDLFTPEQGTRLFGLIAAGGSTGALAGPALAASLTAHMGIPALMLIAALFLIACLFCIHRLLKWAGSKIPLDRSNNTAQLDGGIWAGVRLTVTSPYLLGISSYLFAMSMVSTFIYMEQTSAVAESFGNPSERTQLFARIDFIVCLLSLAIQLLGTKRVITSIGLAGALLILPLASLGGVFWLGIDQALPVLIGITIVRRVCEYSISKPAREVLFTVTGREEKYQAKNFIDTVLLRGSDAGSGWLVSTAKSLGAVTGLLAWALIPLTILCAWLVLWLAKREANLSRNR